MHRPTLDVIKDRSNLQIGRRISIICYFRLQTRIPIPTLIFRICPSVLLWFERSHINGEAIPYIETGESLVSLVDLLDWDGFNLGSDAMFAAKVEHGSNFRARLRRLNIRLTGATAWGLSGLPTRVMLPSWWSNRRNELMSCSAETASRIKSKLFTCLFVSSVFCEITTSSTPQLTAR